jgi:hypothetical protein
MKNLPIGEAEGSIQERFGGRSQKGRFSLAILFFKQAWMHAQMVMQFVR